MAWRQPFIAIDQNQLRDSVAIGRILDECRRDDLKIIIPDGAFMEFSKGGLPLDTARNSLRVLAPHREFVCSSRKLTDMMRDEMERQRPCVTLVHHDTSEFLRTLLSDLDRGDESSLRRIVEGPISDMMPLSLDLWNNHDENKAIVMRLHDSMKSTMRPDQLNALRRSPETGLSDWLSSHDGMRFVFQGLKARGTSDATAYELTRSPSVSAGFLSALAGLAIYWLAFGGLASIDSHKISGDLNDVEYIVLGALSRSLATSDRRASVIYRAVRDAFDSRRSLPASPC